MDTLHDLFFYACYLAAFLIWLHRTLSPVAELPEVPADDPQDATSFYVAMPQPQPSEVFYLTWDETKKKFVKKLSESKTIPAAMPTRTLSVTPTAEDYSVRELRAIAQNKAGGKVKRYKNIPKAELFRQLRQLKLV